jgi:hypothetical protein
VASAVTSGLEPVSSVSLLHTSSFLRWRADHTVRLTFCSSARSRPANGKRLLSTSRRTRRWGCAYYGEIGKPVGTMLQQVLDVCSRSKLSVE